MFQLYKELTDYKHFLREFVLQQMRSRYRGTMLGFAWTLIVPSFLIFTFGFVFSYVAKTDIKTFWPFFVGGYVPWLVFSNAVTASTGSVIGNPQFVTRIYAPKAVFPVAAFALALIEGAALAIAALMALAFFGHNFTLTVLFLPVSVAILLPFVLGSSLLVAAATVFFRDVAFIWAALSSLLFFCTPILYQITAMPATARPIFEANPVYPIVRIFQDPLLGTLPPVDITLTAAMYSVIVLVLGASVFKRSERSFYLYL